MTDDAARRLLLDAQAATRAACAIADDGSAFSVGCGLIAATLRACPRLRSRRNGRGGGYPQA